MFSQAMSSKDSNLWNDVTKYEMNSMTSNQVSNLVKLPNGVNPLDIDGSLKLRNIYKVTLRYIKQAWFPNGSLKGKESITRRSFLVFC